MNLFQFIYTFSHAQTFLMLNLPEVAFNPPNAGLFSKFANDVSGLEDASTTGWQNRSIDDEEDVDSPGESKFDANNWLLQFDVTELVFESCVRNVFCKNKNKNKNKTKMRTY